MTNTYKTIDGDTFDIIAWRVYGSSTLAAHIMRANIHLIGRWSFGPNETVLVPPLTVEDAQSSAAPPWRRNG